MKKFCKFIFDKKWFIFVALICSFLLGYFICDIVNDNKAFYSASFSMQNEELFDMDKIVREDYLTSIKDSTKGTSNDKYKNINVRKMVKNNDFSISFENGKYEIITSFKYYENFFINSSRTLSTRAKMYVKDCVTGINKNVIFDDSQNIVELNNYKNDYLWGLWFLIGGLGLSFSLLLIMFLNNKSIDDNFIYDNITTFRTCFHKKYWDFPLKKVKDITLVSMLFALMIVCKFIPLPSGFGDLGLSFTYLFFATIGLLYGPVVGFAIGIFSDIIGFFINSTGVFNVGYTLQAAFTGMIYGLCFYKTKVNFSKVLLSRILVNFLMNVLFGSFLYTVTFCESPWFCNDFNDFFKNYLLVFSLPKNIFYLLPQSLLLFVIFKLVFPILRKNKYISENVSKHINSF